MSAIARLFVRDVDDKLKERPKERARENGRSLEAEDRQRLRASFGGLDPEFRRGWGDRVGGYGFTQEDLDHMEEIKREPIPEPISFD